MTVRFLDLKRQYEGIKSEVDAAIFEVIENTAFVGGRFVEEFEQDFARYIGTSHCIGVGNGTDALEIAIEALSLPPGSEIIVPANSFIATAEGVIRTGHQVVFADVDPQTYNLTADTARTRLSSNTAAIIPVHLYGQPCDMDPLMAFARENELKVVEDCAQAHGAEYKDKKVGTFGDAATFSFYPGKNLGAYGDGGAVLTNDEKIAVKSRKIIAHGGITKYTHEFSGRNSRLDGIQAAILKVKLKYLDQWIQTRREVALFYDENLAHLEGISTPRYLDCVKHVYHLYVLSTDRREELAAFLSEHQIQTGIHYPTALPKLPAYVHLGQGEEDSFANRNDHRLLSIPMGEHLSLEEVSEVVGAIDQFLSHR